MRLWTAQSSRVFLLKMLTVEIFASFFIISKETECEVRMYYQMYVWARVRTRVYVFIH